MRKHQAFSERSHELGPGISPARCAIYSQDAHIRNYLVWPCLREMLAGFTTTGVAGSTVVGSPPSPGRGLKLLNPSRVTAKVDPVDHGDPGRGRRSPALLRFADGRWAVAGARATW